MSPLKTMITDIELFLPTLAGDLQALEDTASPEDWRRALKTLRQLEQIVSKLRPEIEIYKLRK